MVVTKSKLITFIVILVLVLVVGGLLLFLYSETDNIDNIILDRPIKIGYQANSAHLPTFIGLERYFGEEGLNVEAVKFESANQLMEALVSGRIDAGIGAITVLFSIEQNIPGKFKIFMVNEITKDKYYDFILTKKNSDIKSLQDLKGKKVGTWPGSTILTYLKIILNKNGINPDEVNIQQLAQNLQTQALAAGQVDALFTLEPIATIAIENGIADVLESGTLSKYIMDPMPGASYVISAEFLEKYSKESNRLIAAIKKSNSYIETNQQEAKKVLTKYTPLNEEIALKIHIAPWVYIEDADKPAIRKHADLLFENRELDKRINITNMLYK